MIVVMFTIILLISISIAGALISKYYSDSTKIMPLLKKYVYFIAAPAAVIYAVFDHDFVDSGRYFNFLLINAAVYATLFTLSYSRLKQAKTPYKKAGVVAYSSNTPNTIFIGFPLVFVLFGQDEFVYVALLGSILDAFLNAYRLFLLQRYKKQNK